MSDIRATENQVNHFEVHQVFSSALEKLREQPWFQESKNSDLELINEDPELAAELMTLYRNQATKDTLTGLYSLSVAEFVLAREVGLRNREINNQTNNEEPKPLSVIEVDADNLRDINNQNGHDEGDLYLCLIAKALVEACKRETDVVCRLHGDEFLIIVNTTLENVEIIVSRIREIFSQIKKDEGLLEFTGVSIGIAQWKPGQTVEDLLKKADENLYIDKNNKKNV